MRCLYCGKQLALFKKLTGGGEFCSDAHKQGYHEEYNKLALNRLMEAQTRHEPPAVRPDASARSFSAPEKPAAAQPTARGEYLKQAVVARNPAIAMLGAPSLGPVGRPIELPASDGLQFAPEPIHSGVLLEHRPRSGGTAATASLTLAAPVSSIGLPQLAEVHFTPELGQPGIIMEHRPRSGGTVAPVSLVMAAPASSVGIPEMAEFHFAPEPGESGLIMEHRPRSGDTLAPVSLVVAPAAFPIGLPEMPEVGFAPALSEPGMIVEHGAVSSANAAAPPVADFPQIGNDPECAYPACRFEIATDAVPLVSGPVRFDAHPVPPPEVELRAEAASRFEFAREFPDSLEPDWVKGLELASPEEKLAEPSRVAEDAAEESLQEVQEPVQPEAPAMPLETASVRTSASLRVAATPEPVINEALLLSLFGGKEEPAAGPGLEAMKADAPVVTEANVAVKVETPAAAKVAAPGSQKAVAQAVPDDSEAVQVETHDAVRVDGPALQKADAPVVPEVSEAAKVDAPASPAADARAQPDDSEAAQVETPLDAPAGAKDSVATKARVDATANGAAQPQEPGFMPVTIRPAGAPGKSRLMQSFQAIALVSANPQIPTWNMLPLRPRMALGRPPGPGAKLTERGRAAASAPAESPKTSAAVVEVANGAAHSDDVSAEAKPKSGLSRWFKLSIIAGILGIAGSSLGMERGAVDFARECGGRECRTLPLERANR